MHSVKIKPLSVNQAWQGRRFKTDKYKAYCNQVPLLLPRDPGITPGKLILVLRLYFSSVKSDWDNPIKPLQDIICKHYGIDDKKIYMAIVEKTIVKRREDRVEFEFYPYREGVFDECRNACR